MGMESIIDRRCHRLSEAALRQPLVCLVELKPHVWRGADADIGRDFGLCADTQGAMAAGSSSMR